MTAKRLSACVEHHPGEPALSFASRLAAAMGAGSMRAFCRHMDLRYDHLARGDAEAIGRLADLGGVDFAKLLKHSVIRVGKTKGYEINGQRFTRDGFRTAAFSLCFSCLAEDVRSGSGPIQARPYLRSSWLARTTRFCPVHRIPLTETGAMLDPRVRRDVSVVVRCAGDVLADQQEPVPVPESLFDDYLQGRLFGGGIRNRFLDSLPFHVAADLTEMVGAAKAFGVKFSKAKLSPEDWWEAGRQGFLVTRDGEEGMHRFLSELFARFWDKDRVGPSGTCLGALNAWLVTKVDNPVYAGVCNLIRDHAVQELPLGPGDNFLGPVRWRRWHSVHSAAREFGVHPKRLRKQLATEGFLRPGHECLPDDRTLFEAGAATPFLETVSSSMSAEEAREHGCMSRSIWNLLVQRGHIRPVSQSAALNGSYAVFARADIDGFIARLAASGKRLPYLPSYQPGKPPLLGIPEAAKKAKCSILEIVDLLLHCKLETVAVLDGTSGFKSIYVHAEEVAKYTTLNPGNGFNLRSVERELRTTSRTVKALVVAGHLPTVTAINPVNRCPQTVVPPEALKAFSETYESLSKLAARRGKQIAQLKRELEEAGVHPAFDLGGNAARFYRRDILRRVLPTASGNLTLELQPT